MKVKDGKTILLFLVSVAVLSGFVSCGPVNHRISGTVTDGAGTAVSNVTLTLADSGSGSTVTDTSGNYGFRGLDAGKYFVTPALAGYTFSPPYLEVTIIDRDVSGQDFVVTSTAPPAPPAAIQLPRTGQATSYGTSDDGALQEGVAWPSPRFTDNSDGTVTDNLTGLVWLKNANCFSTVAWTVALADANSLASGACGLTDGSAAGQWRLPNINELESLVSADPSNLSTWLSLQGFGNVTFANYWSSTTVAGTAGDAWSLSAGSGGWDGYDKSNSSPISNYVWPVRSGPQ